MSRTSLRIDRPIARKQGGLFGLILVGEVENRLGDIHQRIAGNRTFEVDGSRQAQCPVFSLGQMLPA